MSRKTGKILLITLVIVLIAIQFVRPEKNEKGYESAISFEKETNTTDQVASLLKAYCYDCHSDQTVYPWYAEVSPVSLWLEDHIVDGKKHFNVSMWNSYSVKKKEHKLEELIEMVEDGEMPLKTYSLLHGKYSQKDKQLLLEWARNAKHQYNNHL